MKDFIEPRWRVFFQTLILNCYTIAQIDARARNVVPKQTMLTIVVPSKMPVEFEAKRLCIMLVFDGEGMKTGPLEMGKNLCLRNTPDLNSAGVKVEC